MPAGRRAHVIVIRWMTECLAGSLRQCRTARTRLPHTSVALELPGWVLGLSPYHHVPKYPSEAFAWRPELGLTLVAALAVSSAWWRYRSRDIG